MNDVEGREEEFTYEQVVHGDNASDQEIKVTEPALITTLAPYNYEIDLPFKQGSAKHKHTCRSKRQLGYGNG